jgi:hypothetical protein
VFLSKFLLEGRCCVAVVAATVEFGGEWLILSAVRSLTRLAFFLLVATSADLRRKYCI